MMGVWSLVLLVLLFFATSVVGVVTGSNSLVTVPVMFQFGIDEKVAVATNMFGLTFMAIGATIPFVRQGSIEFKKLTPLVILTIIGSAIGALLVGVITNQSIKLIVTVAMIAMDPLHLDRTESHDERRAERNPRFIYRICDDILTRDLRRAIQWRLRHGPHCNVRRFCFNEFWTRSRGDKIRKRIFVGNCHSNLYVARFSTLSSRDNSGGLDVRRSLCRSSLRDQAERSLAKTDICSDRFYPRDQNAF
jgi:hypothetical protein